MSGLNVLNPSAARLARGLILSLGAFAILASSAQAAQSSQPGSGRSSIDALKPFYQGERPRTNSGDTPSSSRGARPNPVAGASPAVEIIPTVSGPEVGRTVQTVALFALVSLAPVGLLMLTAFVRIQVVLTLLRQAIGSPQVPGNQVVMALALLLTALVNGPAAERVYREAIEPYWRGELAFDLAWSRGSEPIKGFMLDQIYHTKHEKYLTQLYEYAEPSSPGRPRPTDSRDLPLRVVAPAFLISELTTALWIGFLVYLPFVVIDLVVGSVMVVAGLPGLSPAQVALPLKILVFVLADGWWLVAESLLQTFATGSASGG